MPKDVQVILGLLEDGKSEWEDCLEYEKQNLKRINPKAPLEVFDNAQKNIVSIEEKIQQISYIENQLTWIDATELAKNEWES